MGSVAVSGRHKKDFVFETSLTKAFHGGTCRMTKGAAIITIPADVGSGQGTREEYERDQATRCVIVKNHETER